MTQVPNPDPSGFVLMEVRADRVCVGDFAWLPVSGVAFGEGWVFIEHIRLTGDDVVFNHDVTTSMGNPVVVNRRTYTYL